MFGLNADAALLPQLQDAVAAASAAPLVSWPSAPDPVLVLQPSSMHTAFARATCKAAQAKPCLPRVPLGSCYNLENTLQSLGLGEHMAIGRQHQDGYHASTALAKFQTISSKQHDTKPVWPAVKLSIS